MGNPIDLLLDWPHTTDDQVLLNSALCVVTVGDVRRIRTALAIATADLEALAAGGSDYAMKAAASARAALADRPATPADTEPT